MDVSAARDCRGQLFVCRIVCAPRSFEFLAPSLETGDISVHPDRGLDARVRCVLVQGISGAGDVALERGSVRANVGACADVVDTPEERVDDR